MVTLLPALMALTKSLTVSMRGLSENAFYAGNFRQNVPSFSLLDQWLRPHWKVCILNSINQF